MIYKFAAIGAAALMVTGCVSPQSSETFKANTVINKIENKQAVSALSVKGIILSQNTEVVHNAIHKLQTHVGKTWYVFSGATPAGWDCSGLVMWTYGQMGVTLEHRASKQARSGKIVRSPKLGDIVVFKYKGTSDAYHVGIYYRDGLMIHAPKHGHLTRVENIDSFAGNYSVVSYVRILNTL